MKKRSLVFFGLVISAIAFSVTFNLGLSRSASSAVEAQETHQHQHHHDASENLGQVNFNISCSPSAQKQFNRAAALLHSFWYEEAEKAFTEVTVSDPGCAWVIGESP